jgi:phosphohistidine phosphatase SixA
MKRKTLIQVLFGSLIFPLVSVRSRAIDNKAVVDIKGLAAEIKQGGYVIVFRHGATNRDQADTDPLNYENIAKQRLLSSKGRETAKQVGESFKILGITFRTIYTSKFNRAVETGKLISSREVTPIIDLTEGGLVVTPIENDRRAEVLRKMVATAPAVGTNMLIVTHKPNIIDAFKKDWFDVQEGEASVFKPDESGKALLIARVQANEWISATSPK